MIQIENSDTTNLKCKKVPFVMKKGLSWIPPESLSNKSTLIHNLKQLFNPKTVFAFVFHYGWYRLYSMVKSKVNGFKL